MAKKSDIPRRIVNAALSLAAQQGWRDTSLADIAEEAGISLAELHGHFSSKSAIVRAYQRSIDDAVLAKEDPERAEQSPRDRLFDVVMSRFDVLQTNKEAVRAILRDSVCDPVSALYAGPSVVGSMGWMLEAAGIPRTGCLGRLKSKGLAVLYLIVLRVWLDDDSEDLARTMSALDKQLRRADSLMSLFVRQRRSVVADA
jgi:AcrR family transcriptional regulator